MADHEAEIDLLRNYMDEAGLERLVKESAELVRRDRADRADGAGEADGTDGADDDMEM